MIVDHLFSSISIDWPVNVSVCRISLISTESQESSVREVILRDLKIKGF